MEIKTFEHHFIIMATYWSPIPKKKSGDFFSILLNSKNKNPQKIKFFTFFNFTFQQNFINFLKKKKAIMDSRQIKVQAP